MAEEDRGKREKVESHSTLIATLVPGPISQHLSRVHDRN